MKEKITDCYLDNFEEVEESLFSTDFPWYYQNFVASSADNKLGIYYHVHNIYEYPKGILSDRYELFKPVLEKLGVKSLVKIKVNLYPRTHKIEKHGLHQDQSFKCKTALIYMNTCDGYTYLKKTDKKIMSVANRVLHFNSQNEHHSTTTTNANVRMTVNINYF